MFGYMATFGKIEEYYESESETQYIKKLGDYFKANDITDAGQFWCLYVDQNAMV